jgi:hypothetical protein
MPIDTKLIKRAAHVRRLIGQAADAAQHKEFLDPWDGHALLTDARLLDDVESAVGAFLQASTQLDAMISFELLTPSPGRFDSSALRAAQRVNHDRSPQLTVFFANRAVIRQPIVPCHSPNSPTS